MASGTFTTLHLIKRWLRDKFIRQDYTTFSLRRHRNRTQSLIMPTVWLQELSGLITLHPALIPKETETRTSFHIVYYPTSTLYPALPLRWNGIFYPWRPSQTSMNTVLLLSSPPQEQPVDFKVFSATISSVQWLWKDNIATHIVKCSRCLPERVPSQAAE